MLEPNLRRLHADSFQDETVITVNLMELAVMNSTSTGAIDSLLNMTSPRSLVCGFCEIDSHATH